MDETTLEARNERLSRMVQVRNQIIKAQREMIARQEETFHQLLQWDDCRCGIGENPHRDPGDETKYATMNDMENMIAGGYDPDTGRFVVDYEKLRKSYEPCSEHAHKC